MPTFLATPPHSSRSDGTPTFCTIPHKPSAMHWCTPASASGTGTGGSLWMKDRISPSAKTTHRLDTVPGRWPAATAGPTPPPGFPACGSRCPAAPPRTPRSARFLPSPRPGHRPTAGWPCELSAPTYRTVRAWGKRKKAPVAMQLACRALLHSRGDRHVECASRHRGLQILAREARLPQRLLHGHAGPRSPPIPRSAARRPDDLVAFQDHHLGGLRSQVNANDSHDSVPSDLRSSWSCSPRYLLMTRRFASSGAALLTGPRCGAR